MELKFFRCSHCKNIILFAENKGVPVVCCGEPMGELVPNTTDAAQEKHVPVIAVEGNSVKVSVGSVAHPMLPEHHIAWIWLQTDKGVQCKTLPVDGAPEVTFAISADEKVVAAYEYCNLHGLWKASV